MIEELKKLLEDITNKNYSKKTIVYLAVAIELLEKIIKKEEEMNREKFQDNSSEEHKS